MLLLVLLVVLVVLLLVVVVGVGGAAAVAPPCGFECTVAAVVVPWWDRRWPLRRCVVVNNTIAFTGLSATDSEDLFGLPVLVRLPALDPVHAAAQSGGADIRFVGLDLGGQPLVLAHEIDVWDPSGGSTVWVGLPLVLADMVVVFHMYYANPLVPAPAPAVAEQVWRSRFVVVQHLGGSVYADSTANGNDGSAVGTVTGDTGVVGTASRFDGTSVVDIGNPATVQITGAFAIEGWYYGDFSANSVWLSKYGQSGNRGWDMSFDIAGTDFTTMFRWTPPPGSSSRLCPSPADVPPLVWVHAVGTVQPSQFERYYINGTLVFEDTTGIPGAVYDSSAGLCIGGSCLGTAGGDRFTGTVDEVRVSNVARSTAWVRATFLAMTGSFADVCDTEENVHITAATTTAPLSSSGGPPPPLPSTSGGAQLPPPSTTGGSLGGSSGGPGGTTAVGTVVRSRSLVQGATTAVGPSVGSRSRGGGGTTATSPTTAVGPSVGSRSRGPGRSARDEPGAESTDPPPIWIWIIIAVVGALVCVAALVGLGLLIVARARARRGVEGGEEVSMQHTTPWAPPSAASDSVQYASLTGLKANPDVAPSDGVPVDGGESDGDDGGGDDAVVYATLSGWNY